MTHVEIQPLIAKYTARWNADSKKDPLWVIGANPGDALPIPGVTFARTNDPKAGMEMPIRAHLIVLNQAMLPESILTTFLHEYGHALHRYSASREWNIVDSEAEAIRFSLAALDVEGLAYLAYREADAVKRMASNEPYKSAIKKLAGDAHWRKYARLESTP
jgi:hypothetical protein